MLNKCLLLLCLMVALPALSAVQVELKGQLQQGALIIGKTAPNSQIELDGVRLKQSPEGYFVFGFDRDAKAQATLSVQNVQGEQWQQVLQITARQYAIQRIEGIQQSIVSDNKTEAEWQRIKDEADLVANARKRLIENKAFLQPMIWPVTGPITGVFGSQRVYNGVPSRPHYGLDIAAAKGTPVKAPADGVVTMAHDDMYYSGGTLIVDHGYGVSSSFLHLSKILVKLGDAVKQGDIIAEVGAAGRSTGPHLDWRINWFAHRLDAQLLVPKTQ